MVKKIGIVNYHTSNIANVIRAIKYCDADYKLISEPSDLNGINKIILPGVGSFIEAAKFLKKKN